MRRAIAAAMARSNREIPHYYLETRIDMSRALRWLEAENLKRSIKERILPVVLLLKAVARALGEVPELNGYWIEDRFQAQEAINIGFAISLRQGGLITPALLSVDTKSLDEVMEAMRDLITRTRAGRLRSSEMTDATITVTSLGDLGVETVYGVIYPPQVALVGFGKITEQPWAENGMLGIRPVVMRHSGRGPSRHGRAPRRSVSGRAQPLFAGAGKPMTEAEIRETIFKLLGRIAPEADFSTLAPDDNLRRTLDIDSFDALNFFIALHEELGVEIPRIGLRPAQYPGGTCALSLGPGRLTELSASPLNISGRNTARHSGQKPAGMTI